MTLALLMIVVVALGRYSQVFQVQGNYRVQCAGERGAAASVGL